MADDHTGRDYARRNGFAVLTDGAFLKVILRIYVRMVYILYHLT